ncbi:vWA domain-containing protein [Streptomyces roseoverticillatus]|uniref:vWA domain-containing protein n=1 Tax=Streptomyces roseoverticillatus TaxID=66429 RepID=UPI001F256BA1|nr:VWA domain-containing protein [Streptomyces roseoverticillatus]
MARPRTSAEETVAEPVRAPVPPQQGGGGSARVAEPVDEPVTGKPAAGDPDDDRIPDPGPLEPTPQPGPTPGPRPGPGPVPPEPSPQPEPEPTPMPSPKPIPQPHPVPPVEPEPVPEPAPGPDPVRKPEPAPGPTPEPAPAMPPRDEAPAQNAQTAESAQTAQFTETTETTETTEATEAAETTQHAQTAPMAQPAQTAAISLEKVEQRAPGLISLYKAAGASLEKQGLTGQRAAVYLVLDRSGSMREFYKNGTVQHLAEQALGLSAHLDDDGTVPVVFFSTDVDGVAEVELGSHEGRIEELHSSMGHMGRTNYHWAMEAVIEHYKKSGSSAPAFVIFQTDGGPYSKAAAERALCESANLPIFWQFVAFGDPEGKGFDFLRKLDALPVPEKRVVDNAGFFHAGRDPKSLTDAQLYAELMVEFPDWLKEARAAGIVEG